MKPTHLFIFPTLLTLLTLLALPAPLLAQGDLDPPGAPAPTMKSLDQIEPRTDLAEVSGDDDTAHIIKKSGSYYLSSNANVFPFLTDVYIEIRASGVTLDLAGFTISPAPLAVGGEFDAIAIAADNLHTITIRNGHIAGPSLGTGIFAEGAASDAPTTVRVTGVSVSDCSGVGIAIGGIGSDPRPTNTVDHCSVRQCGSGINAGKVSHSIVTDSGGSGILADGGVSHSSATDCGRTAISADGNVSHSTGVSTGSDAIAAGIRADGNVTNSNGKGQAGRGISASGGNVTNSTGESATNIGILADNVTNCTGESDSSFGISVSGNVINSVGESGNGTGIISNGGTVSKSIGKSFGDGVGIDCDIAIGCTTVGGENIGDKYLMP